MKKLVLVAFLFVSTFSTNTFANVFVEYVETNKKATKTNFFIRSLF